MSTIVTLTMNPALDVSTDTDEVIPGEKLRCGPTALDPGGGGVNVSRVIHRLGGSTVAVYIAGGLTGDLYSTLLAKEGVPAQRITIDGETRESFTVTEESTGKQYRFVLAGPEVTSANVDAVVSALDDLLQPGDWLVASGSLPPGVPDDFYGSVAARFSAKGVSVVVDTAPPWLRPAISGGVFVVKPSRHELEQFLGRDIPDLKRQVEGAREMIAQAGVQWVALSLGGKGALLVSADHAWHSVAPGVTPVSTVGAGDSFLAGLVQSLSTGEKPETALAYAVAAGSATAASPATALCEKQAVESVLAGVVTTTLLP
jgi:6-phosphofructokinase 2